MLKYVIKKVFLKTIINTYMNYLVSMFDCVLYGNERFRIIKNVKYEIEDSKSPAIVFSYDNVLPFVFDIFSQSENVLKIDYGLDKYFFLFPTCVGSTSVTKLNIKGHEIIITCGSELVVTISGQTVLEKNVNGLKYSHYEEHGNLCLIYFLGKRNFLLALKNKEVCFANYYDECNISEKEKYFMCRLNDSLNHGTVFYVKENNNDSYLVYLDDEELKLKKDFVAHVFLDCVLAKNFKYCNAQLSKELQLEDEKKLIEFFPDFDWYYPLSDVEFILIKKNTLAGIYKFEIVDNCICNITQCLQ